VLPPASFEQARDAATSPLWTLPARCLSLRGEHHSIRGVAVIKNRSASTPKLGRSSPLKLEHLAGRSMRGVVNKIKASGRL
jgi:hypothetical protein